MVVVTLVLNLTEMVAVWVGVHVTAVEIVVLIVQLVILPSV